MPASLTAVAGIVKWLSELSGGEATGVLVGGMAGTVWLIVKGVVAGFRRKTAAEIAKVDVPVAQMPVPPPALPPPPPAPIPPDNEAELQAARAQRLATEAALLDTQLAIRRVRAAMDEHVRASAKTEGELMAANVLAVAENERLRAELAKVTKACEVLQQEMAVLRTQGPPSVPPRQLPPLRGGRER